MPRITDLFERAPNHVMAIAHEYASISSENAP
jgi:hypothetical protein